jgi:Putative zinc-finger
MNGHEDPEQLSAYLDDALAPDERRRVQAHLESCPECRRELASLRETVALLQRVQPARAPAGFAARVVAAARPRPWYRRAAEALLLPVTVKLPLQATAAVMIGLLAVYLFERTPEVQQAARPEAPPSEIAADRRGPVSNRPEPALAPAAKAKPAPSAPRLERELARPDAGARQDAPALRDPAPPAAAPPIPAPPPAPAAPAPPRSETASTDARTEARKEADAERSAGGTAPPEPERRRALERAPDAGRLASPRLAAKRAQPSAAADVVTRVAVRDREAAERELAALIERVGGRVAERRGEADATVVEAVVPQPRYAEFSEGLGRIGSWQVEAERPDLPAQVRVILRLQ